MTATTTNSQVVSLLDIQDNGVVGAGGAGFPTHVKLKASAEFIILNAAECEPLLHKDKELLRAFPDLIIAGLAAAGQLVGARQAIIGIKGKYHDVIEMLGPRLPANMKIVELTDSYPAGDEFILVYDTTGRIIAPGKIPLTVGCVVINVETALNIARKKPVTSKFLTIAGAVKHPVTVEVPIGITFAQAVALAGGPSCEKPVLLVGGAMMGKYSDDMNQPITKTTGGLIVLPENHRLVLRYKLDWPSISRIGASCCDQCSFCTSFCPRYLLGHPVEPHKAMRSLGYNQVGEPNILGSMYCCECNLCTMMACPEDLDPKNVMSHNKRKLASEGKKWDAPTYPDRAEMNLNDRRVPIPRLITKLGLSEFTNKGPLESHALKVSKVTLPLRQHVGAPAKPVVKVGDKVTVGQAIARPDANALGAVLHASLAGIVTQIEPNIVIEA